MDMINGQELLEIALQIEENGKVFYLKAIESIDNKEVKKMLQRLAAWEEGHIHKIQELQALFTPAHGEFFFDLFSSPEEDTSLYIKTVANSHIFVKTEKSTELINNSSSTEEILDIAMTFEKDSVMYYSSLYEGVVDKESAVVLKEIIDEEKAHVIFIQKMIDGL